MSKYLFSTIIVLLFAVTMQAQVKISYKSETTAIVELIEQEATFVNRTLDFGDVKKGDKKETKFEFKNTGIKPLEIELVSGCECTTLDWTRGPINPGGTGIINVLFDSTEKENSNPVDVDIYFKPLPGSNKEPLFEICSFKFQLTQ